MSARRAAQSAAMIGLTIAAALALWWLGAARIALDEGSDASPSAAAALRALLLVRLIVVAIAGARAGACRGARAGAAETTLLVAPSWPLVALAGSASNTPWSQIALAELGLLAAGVVAALLGNGLRRLSHRTEFAEALATAIGVLLAASAWLARGSFSFGLA
jgi:hypothetical protein